MSHLHNHIKSEYINYLFLEKMYTMDRGRPQSNRCNNDLLTNGVSSITSSRQSLEYCHTGSCCHRHKPSFCSRSASWWEVLQTLVESIWIYDHSLVPRPRFPTAAGGLHHRSGDVIPPQLLGIWVWGRDYYDQAIVYSQAQNPGRSVEFSFCYR